MKIVEELTLTHATDMITGEGQRGAWTKTTLVFTSGSDTIPVTAFNHAIPSPGRYKVELIVDGRMYNDKYYPEIRLVHLEPMHEQVNANVQLAQPQPQQASMKEQLMARNNVDAEAVNDLPF